MTTWEVRADYLEGLLRLRDLIDQIHAVSSQAVKASTVLREDVGQELAAIDERIFSMAEARRRIELRRRPE